MREEDGCTRLNGTLAIELEGKREHLQRIQGLVPIRYLSLDRNVIGLRRSLGAGYSDADVPLEKIFPDNWDIDSKKD